jgi:hypothetical protein
MFTRASIVVLNAALDLYSNALNAFTHTRIAALTTAAAVVVAGVSFIPATAAVEKSPKMFMPRQAFSQTLGSKQTVGFFEEKDGRCLVTLMVAETFDVNSDRTPASAARIRVSLEPMHSAQVESAESQSLMITCGAMARSVSVSAAPEALM